MMSQSSEWKQHAVFACGYALQFYWPYGMIIFAHELLKGTFAEVSMSKLLTIYATVGSRLSGLRVANGALVVGNAGRSPTANPAERRNGAVRYGTLA